MRASGVVTAIIMLAALLPWATVSGLPDPPVQPTAATRMQVMLVDDTLLWTRPLLSAGDLPSARFHVYGLDAEGNATLLSVEGPANFSRQVPGGYRTYGVAVEKAGVVGQMTLLCVVIYTHRIPPEPYVNCYDIIPDVLPPDVKIPHQL